MLRNALVLALAVLTVLVFGMPKELRGSSEFDQSSLKLPRGPSVPGQSRPRPNMGGQHDSADRLEIRRLNALVKAQKEKISLLEAKIKLLETEHQNKRGASK
jgi:hypothetical protein